MILSTGLKSLTTKLTRVGHLARIQFIRKCSGGFPGGAVVKNLPVSAGDMGSSLSPGRSHMPWSN